MTTNTDRPPKAKSKLVKQPSLFVRFSQNILGATAAVTLLITPTLSSAGEEKSYVQTVMEDKAKAAVMKIALKLAPDVMNKIGLGEVWTLFMGAPPTKSLDYQRLGGIVADELKKHDYAISNIEGLAQLEASVREFSNLTTPSLRDSLSTLDYGSKLTHIYNTLGAVKIKFEPYKVETIYARTAIDTLMMKTYTMMAFDRKLHSGYNARTMEKTIMDLSVEYAHLTNNMIGERIGMIQCVDGHVVDTMNSNLKLSPPQGGYCERLTTHLRSMIAGYEGAVAYCENSFTLRAVVVEGQTIVPEQHICSQAGVKVGSWRVFEFEGAGDQLIAAEAKASELSSQLYAIHEDAKARWQHSYDFADNWNLLLESARLVQRKITSADGEQVTDFSLTNNSSSNVDLMWHARDGKTMYMGSIEPGGTYHGGQTAEYHWFGIYSDTPELADFTGYHDAAGYRLHLVCNVQFKQSSHLGFDSTDPTRACRQVDDLQRDKTTKKIGVDAYVKHQLADGSETYSLGMPLAQCLELCAGTPECMMVRTERANDNSCLMGRSAGEDDFAGDMYSYSRGGSRQYDVLAN